MTIDPAEMLRIWQPVIDVAREFAHAVDDPEEYETKIAEAVYGAEAAMEAEEAKARLMTDWKPTYAEYLAAVDGLHKATPHSDPWRLGQTYFNVLHTWRPDLANAVRGTAADPFYDDARIDDFLMFIQVNWEA